MVSEGWVVNMAAGAATSALFAPGAFQQSGWFIALTVSLLAFMFSVTSLAAYTSLTSLTYKVQRAIGKRRVQVRGSDNKLQVLSSLSSDVSPFRAAAPFTKLAFQSQKIKDDASKDSAFSALPESSQLVDFFGESPIMTWVFEAVQLAQVLAGFLLKTASAVDLLTIFVVQENAEWLTEYPVLAGWLTTDGMAGFVGLFLFVLRFLPKNAKLQKGIGFCADVAMLLLHVLLGALIISHVWGHWTHVIAKASLLKDPSVTHLSETFELNQRIFYACCAALVSFLPHATTPAVFREVAGPTALWHLFKAQVVQLALFWFYFVGLGAGMDVLLPTGRTTSRLAVFNFVDYRTWLPNADESHYIVLFALVPMVHLVSAVRGCVELVVSLGLRLMPGGLRVKLDSSTLSAVQLAVVLSVALSSVTQRPIFTLIISNCILQGMYIYLFLKAQFGLGVKHEAYARWRNAILEGDDKEGAGLSYHWMLIALGFWCSCFLYWVSYHFY